MHSPSLSEFSTAKGENLHVCASKSLYVKAGNTTRTMLEPLTHSAFTWESVCDSLISKYTLQTVYLIEHHEIKPDGKKGPRKPLDLQGSSPPSSGMMHPNTVEIRQKWMNKELLSKPKHKKEAYGCWRQGQVTCEE